MRKKALRKPVGATAEHTIALYPSQHAAALRLLNKLALYHGLDEVEVRGDLLATLQDALQITYRDALSTARTLVTNIMPPSRERDRLVEKLDRLCDGIE